MSAIGDLVGTLLLLFILVMLARLVLDWVSVAGEGPSWLTTVRRATHTLTEPVIAPVRRVLRPVRIGTVSLDLAFTVVFIAVLVLRSIVVSL